MTKLGCLIGTVMLLVWTISLASKCTASNNSSNTITCGLVTPQLVPCLTFITDKVKAPSSMCCTGTKMVADMAKTVTDRRDVCSCIKVALKNIVGINYDHISEIPKDCNLSITLPPIRNNTDCNSISTASLFA